MVIEQLVALDAGVCPVGEGVAIAPFVVAGEGLVRDGGGDFGGNVGAVLVLGGGGGGVEEGDAIAAGGLDL